MVREERSTSGVSTSFALAHVRDVGQEGNNDDCTP